MGRPSIKLFSRMFVLQRPSSDLVVSLRAALQKLAEDFRSADDQPIMTELRRLLLLYIADLDNVEASETGKSTEK